ncbi:MAG TPA: AMP-binding protein [Bauldia sp.]|nr:AMP-binding protein [Bauldia sp.]
MNATAMVDPEVEARPWPEQHRTDDSDYRRQAARLLADSRFYKAKLQAAGVRSAADIGGLDAIAALPFTEKDELRATRTAGEPIGTHLIPPLSQIARIFSTSGTTGTPSYVPLTREDLTDWITVSRRSYGASGLTAGCRLISTYGAGPFVAGVTLDTFNALGLTHIPVGSGNTDRLVAAVQLLKADTVALTPSYALHIAEWCTARGIDLSTCNVERLLVAGEPGGGEPATRKRLEEAWGANVTEAMGIGDICVSLWGECQEKHGMHFSGRGFVHFELIDPQTGSPVEMRDGATGELVYTHLRHRAAPLLRFRSRDHVVVWTSPCACGRTSPRVRCIGRTDDMLVVRAVNVFPTAIRALVNEFSPAVSGVIAVRPRAKGFRQDPPLPVVVEVGEDQPFDPALAERIHTRLREALSVTTEITLVAHGSLPRTSYKTHLVDWSQAQ